MPTLQDIERGIHRNETLLRDVLAGQTEIKASLATILTQQEKIMSGESDLQAAIAANGAAITAATTEINSLATQLVAAANGDSDASIETLAQQLQAQTAQLNLAVSNATNPPAPVQSNTAGAAVTSSPTQSGSASPAGQSSQQPPSTQATTGGSPTTASTAGTGGTSTAAISVSAAANLTPAQAATITPQAAATLTPAHTSAMPAEAAAALTPQAAAALTPAAKAALKPTTSTATGKA